MKPSFLPQLLHRGFFPASMVVPALALALLTTLSTNGVAQSLKNAIPSIGAALHSIDQSIQLFEYKSPSSTQQAQVQAQIGTGLLSLLIHSNERILFWTKKQNSPLTSMTSNATKPSSHHPQDMQISINLTLTCDAPYMTRWVVESNGASEKGNSNMNYISRSYPRPYIGFQKPSTNSGGSSQTSPETSTAGGILNPNIEELIITSFDPNFQSGFVECVRVRDPQDGTMDILKSRLYIFQRFGDGQSQSFRDSHNDTLEASPEPKPEPFIIPCKTHDPDAQPRLVLNGADVSNDFEYDWKLGFTLKSSNPTTTSVVTHGDEYSCVLLSKDSDISNVENSRVFYKFVKAKANNRTEITESRIVNQNVHLTNSGRGEFVGGTITTQSPTPTPTPVPVSVPVSTVSTSNTNEREDPENKNRGKFEEGTESNDENNGNDYEGVIDNSNGKGDTGTGNNEMMENNGNHTGVEIENLPRENNNVTINLNETIPDSGMNSGNNNNATGTERVDNVNANQESKRTQSKIGTLVGSISGVIVFVILILGCSVYFYCKKTSGEHALKAKNTNIHEMY